MMCFFFLCLATYDCVESQFWNLRLLSQVGFIHFLSVSQWNVYACLLIFLVVSLIVCIVIEFLKAWDPNQCHINNDRKSA